MRNGGEDERDEPPGDDRGEDEGLTPVERLQDADAFR